MKQLFVISGWVIATCLTISLSVGLVVWRTTPIAIGLYATDTKPVIHAPKTRTSPVAGITTNITTEDARPVLIAQFLETNHSPLKPYDYWGEFLTQIADKYNMDYRLLPSIAMQESNLCKKIPEGTYNCLGLGIHSRGTWAFPSFESNFEKAAEILRRNYMDMGLITPDQIQNKYTPSSNGSWEFAVNHFMDKLETADF